MQVAVLGAGSMGRAMSALFARHGARVVLGTRAAALGTRTIETTSGPIETRGYREAVDDSELVVLTTPWGSTEGVVRAAGPFAQRILIDCTNPEDGDSRFLVVGLTSSGAEQVAEWAADARVVKAFNHVYAEVLSSAEAMTRGVSVFLSSDHDEAKTTVAALAKSFGFDPVDAGPLYSARFLEPLAMLMVQLVRRQGLGPAGAVLRLDRSVVAQSAARRA